MSNDKWHSSMASQLTLKADARKLSALSKVLPGFDMPNQC